MSLSSYLPAWAYVEELRKVIERIPKMDMRNLSELYEIAGRLTFIESHVRRDNAYASNQLRKTISSLVDQAYQKSLLQEHKMTRIFEKLGIGELDFTNKDILKWVNSALKDIETKEKYR